MAIKKEQFGITKNQETVTKYTLTNHQGMQVSLINLGAVITEIVVPDKNGVMENVALGFDTVQDYETNKPAFGAVIGRVANRIANGSFTLNGKKYTLDQNDETNCLHGGFTRYERSMYEAECTEREDSDSVSFTRLSPDMEQGFPGNLTVTVTYTLNDDNELMLEYYAVCDADTVINLTNHCYFNIGKGGHKCANVLDHTLQIFADSYTPVDEILIPTGEIRSVENTALDFRTPYRIGERIGTATADESIVAGYDHNYVLGDHDGEVSRAVVYSDKESGRVMEVFTDFPGMQVYSAAELDIPNGKDGMHYGNFGAICFETQNYPDAVNQTGFPDAVLKAGEEYERTAVFRFGVIE